MTNSDFPKVVFKKKTIIIIAEPVLSLAVLAKLVWSLIVLARPLLVIVVLVYPLVVLVFPLAVLVFPFVCPFVVLVCPLVVLDCLPLVSVYPLVVLVLSVDLFITDQQPPRGVLRKKCSENMQQIYRRFEDTHCQSVISVKLLSRKTIFERVQTVKMWFTDTFRTNKKCKNLFFI